MTRISSIIGINSNTNIAFRSNYQTLPNKSDSVNNDKVSEKYLDNLAMINAPAIKKVDNKPAKEQNYKNNLRSMIRNNESVMLAIVPRIFNAKDLDGDDRISIKKGEQVGTFLNAIERLDELKADGFNTIHILPIILPERKMQWEQPALFIHLLNL